MTDIAELLPALFEFTVYHERGMPQIIRLSQVFIDAPTRNLSNGAMQFLISNATDKVVDHLLLRTVEAFILTNEALEYFNEPELKRNETMFSDLFRLRNKLVSHKVANDVLSNKHQEWKSSNYNSSKKVTDLVVSCSNAICDKIEMILEEHQSSNHAFQVRLYKEFNDEHFAKVLNALKDAGIY